MHRISMDNVAVSKIEKTVINRCKALQKVLPIELYKETISSLMISGVGTMKYNLPRVIGFKNKDFVVL